MAKFKIGDRVQMAEHHSDSKPIKIGWLGTVIMACEGSSSVGVSWDKYSSGHNWDDLKKMGRPKDSGWWMQPECLRLVVDAEEPEAPEPAPKPAVPESAPKPIHPISKPKPSLDDMVSAAIAAIANGITKPKPASTESEPEAKKKSSDLDKTCCNCQNFQSLSGCEYGFCKSWHNFCNQTESCSRFKICG